MSCRRSARPRAAPVVTLDSSSDEDEPSPAPPPSKRAARAKRCTPARRRGGPASAAAAPPRKAALSALLGGTGRSPKASSAPSGLAPSGLWSEVHAPAGPEGLVVHKKKVQEVAAWLEAQAAAVGEATVPRVLVVTGPPGCGKSATLRVLAAPAGLALCEWQAPTPTLWSEHTYQAGAAVKYTSKLDAFEEFVLRSKMPALVLSRGGGSSSGSGPTAQQPTSLADARGRPKLIVIDDLPYAAGQEQRQRLVAAVGDLARTTRFPVVLCATTESAGGSGDRAAPPASAALPGVPKDIAAALQRVGPAVIAFNPITALNVAKALRAVLEAEGLALPDSQVLAIAEQAGGDLRSALSTLQLVCSGLPVQQAAAAAKPKKGRGAKRKQEAPPEGGGGPGAPSYAARDASLGLFHALGKLLYNKRLPAAPAGSPGQPPGSGLADWCRRPPMEVDPEGALDASGMEAGSVAAFLHENLPAFVAEDSVGDLATALAYLSEADVIAAGAYRRGDRSELADDELPARTLCEAAAGSTAARGVCFGVAHAAPRRWQPLRAPAVFAAQRAAALNAARLDWAAASSWAVGANTRHLESRATMACELVPAARVLAARTRSPALEALMPARWARVWQGRLHDADAGQQPGGAAQRARGAAYEADLLAGAPKRATHATAVQGQAQAAAGEEEDPIED